MVHCRGSHKMGSCAGRNREIQKRRGIFLTTVAEELFCLLWPVDLASLAPRDVESTWQPSVFDLSSISCPLFTFHGLRFASWACVRPQPFFFFSLSLWDKTSSQKRCVDESGESARLAAMGNSQR